MKKLSNIVAVVALVWLAGCAPALQTNFDHDRSVNFRKYSTYKVEPVKGDDKDPVLNSELNQERVKNAVVDQMKARGYTYSEENPQLVIRYFTDVQNRQETQSNNTYGYWGWWGRPSNTYTRNYREARLVINMVDAATDRLVWQGWAEGEENNNRREDRDAAIRLTVSRILEQYPHRASQGYNDEATSRR
jgi:hypothetical protein